MIRDLRIRAAQPADAAAIGAVLERCGLPVDDLARLVGEFHVAVLESQIVGCACAELFGDSAIVRSVAVLREWRDQGIASHLVNAVMMRARANGSRRAVLLTSTCPSYFARYGFTLIHASKLPPEILESKEFQRMRNTSALCMCCELA
ncbi:amino-acid N-acetyltransferase [Cupriavidus metallidurans]|jgi:amino-acid N-acetyltransferase|uniref:GCN5-related N-acetyltransferase n=2 Tax=Cupriavidus metallidurans TaxID=119219 RepID=Q1LRZ4_CUPMC|nr:MULTISPECIES: GNAT family N-acetyltransferase [Cupriavidus]HBO76974.1 GNAT family N-acetyltransferase [Cupriavidus sp.]ABF07082.1 GCN5-related N-acetyltransferase [Cupriavidus metallidurans CH34]AVA32306.1 GNAT family N-acetyltransferase [Cupriavidus metallidurans]ELA00959.1 GCN5-like N-acetyltransferase [Cupriavidus sp. HMR-1]KWR80420.1 N-acetylglutamate synthase [Cupriavidus sp. SHE]